MHKIRTKSIDCKHMKLATWNVQLLKVRLPHVLDWLAANQPDALCLQELKCENKGIPL